jgi:hypothetical protein
MSDLTQERLKSILHYEPSSGVFTWVNCPNRPDLTGKVAGGLDDKGYTLIRIGELYRAHRLAFLYMEGEFPLGEVGHHNCVRDDNGWVNLYKCTHQENMNNPITKATLTLHLRSLSKHPRSINQQQQLKLARLQRSKGATYVGI